MEPAPPWLNVVVCAAVEDQGGACPFCLASIRLGDRVGVFRVPVSVASTGFGVAHRVCALLHLQILGGETEFR